MHMVRERGGRLVGGVSRTPTFRLPFALPLLLCLLAPERAGGYGGNEEALVEQHRQLNKVRISYGNAELLAACEREGKQVVLKVAVEDVAGAGGAWEWVRRAVLPHASAIAGLAVGEADEYISMADLRHLQEAVAEAGLAGKVKVSAPRSCDVLKNPEAVPSAAALKESEKELVEFLVQTGGVFMLDVHSSFLEKEELEVVDPRTRLRYRTRLDLVLDSVLLAMAGMGGKNVPLLVTQTEVEGAVSFIWSGKGTPLMPDAGLLVYYAGKGVEEAVGGVRRELATLRTWCVAKTNADQTALQTALNWACGPGQADCAILQQGQTCFSPNTLFNHASYAFNSYYQSHGYASGTCDFGGTATTTNTDPSTPGCTYPASDSSAVTSSPNGTSGSGAVASLPPCSVPAIFTLALLISCTLAFFC